MCFCSPSTGGRPTQILGFAGLPGQLKQCALVPVRHPVSKSQASSARGRCQKLDSGLYICIYRESSAYTHVHTIRIWYTQNHIYVCMYIEYVCPWVSGDQTKKLSKNFKQIWCLKWIWFRTQHCGSEPLELHTLSWQWSDYIGPPGNVLWVTDKLTLNLTHKIRLTPFKLLLFISSLKMVLSVSSGPA